MAWFNCELCKAPSQKKIIFFYVDNFWVFFVLLFIPASFCNRCPAFYLSVRAREGHQIFNLYWGKKSRKMGLRIAEKISCWCTGIGSCEYSETSEGLSSENDGRQNTLCPSLISRSRKSKCQKEEESARESRDIADIATDVLTHRVFRTFPSKQRPSLADKQEKRQRRNKVISWKIHSKELIHSTFNYLIIELF